LANHEGILANVLVEIRRKNVLLKNEAALCIANMLQHCDKPALIKNLLKHNLMGIIHDELCAGVDHGVFQVVAI